MHRKDNVKVYFFFSREADVASMYPRKILL